MRELERVIMDSFYSIVFMLITQVAAVIVSLKNRKKFSELKYFHFYPIASFSINYDTGVNYSSKI
jgi:hypothetical protein